MEILKIKNPQTGQWESVPAIQGPQGPAAPVETPEIIIPPNLYAVAGHEFVLYYQNILKCMMPEKFIVTTEQLPSAIMALYPEYDNMLRFTPTADMVGSYTINIKVVNRETWTAAANKTTTLVISADTARHYRKIMFIGDSLLYAGVYAAEIANMSNGGLTSIGTVDHAITFNGSTVHAMTEGRNGYASYDYVTYQTVHSADNPFYNPNASYQLTLDANYNGRTTFVQLDNSGALSVLTHHFDFAYYMANNGETVGTPDAVFICLGTNGGNLYALPDVYIGIDAMIDRIKAYDADMPVFLHLFPPTSMGGNGARNTAVRTVNAVNDCRKAWYTCIQTLIDRYKNNPNVTIVPTETMLDPIYDYKRETVAISARNAETITIGQTDSTHPALSGYLHMADSYYNVLQALWTTDDPSTPIPTYTNLNSGAGTVMASNVGSVDACVYQAGYYISISGPGTLNVDANATTFGLIPAQDGDAIYIKGIPIYVGNSPTTAATHARLGFAKHDTSTDKESWIQEHKFYNASTSYVTLTLLDAATNYYRIDIGDATGLDYDYVGISLDTTNGGAADLIITKNQPIQ